jgi:hypothetical protein
MQATISKDKRASPIVREYDIGGIKYTVKATVKAGVSENATVKVRRLIKREISNKSE